MTIRRFFAPPAAFNEGTVSLGVGETRHLRDVLRLKAGDEVRIFDGEEKEFLCAVVDIKRSATTLDVLAEVEPPAPESDLELTIAAAVYKSDKLDLVVQKAVELGVATFSPIVTLRGELKLRDALKRTDRWRKIALEATKQCERSRVMSVEEPVLFSDYFAEVDKASGLLVMFSEKDGKPIPTTPNAH